MKVFQMFILVTLLIAGMADNSFSEQQNKEGHVSAIQSRVFHRTHEISLGSGYISNDDFYNVFPLSLGYTLHFNELFAWEVARGHYIFNREKDLKADLENNFGVTPTVIREPKAKCRVAPAAYWFRWLRGVSSLTPWTRFRNAASYSWRLATKRAR